MASSRPALTEAPAAHNQAALGTARSIPGRALASSMLDSPCQGSRTGLTPPISTPVPSTPAPPRATRSASRRRPLQARHHTTATRQRPRSASWLPPSPSRVPLHRLPSLSPDQPPPHRPFRSRSIAKKVRPSRAPRAIHETSNAPIRAFGISPFRQLAPRDGIVSNAGPPSAAPRPLRGSRTGRGIAVIWRASRRAFVCP